MKSLRIAIVVLLAAFVAACPKSGDIILINETGQSVDVVHPKYAPLTLDPGERLDARSRKYFQVSEKIGRFVYPLLSIRIQDQELDYILETPFGIPDRVRKVTPPRGFSAGGVSYTAMLYPDLQIYAAANEGTGRLEAVDPQPDGFPIAPIDPDGREVELREPK